MGADREERPLRVRSLPAADDVSDPIDRNILEPALVHEFDDALRPHFLPEGGSRNFAELDLEPDRLIRPVMNALQRLSDFGESRNGAERIFGLGRNRRNIFCLHSFVFSCEAKCTDA